MLHTEKSLLTQNFSRLQAGTLWQGGRMLPALAVGARGLALSHRDSLLTATSTGISAYFTWERALLLQGGCEEAVCLDSGTDKTSGVGNLQTAGSWDAVLWEGWLTVLFPCLFLYSFFKVTAPV